MEPDKYCCFLDLAKKIFNWFTLGLVHKFTPFLPNLAPFLEGQIFVQNLTKKGARLDKNFAQIGTFWKVIFFTNLAPFLTNLLAKSHYYFCPILHLFDVHFLPKFAPFFKMLNLINPINIHFLTLL